MPKITLTKKAEGDLASIASYTLEQWGQAQTLSYVNALQQASQNIAFSPKLGKACDDLSSGLRAFPHQSHIIYYLEHSDGIVIVRILHKNMQPDLHITD